jgi:hypothetical protein
MGPDCGLTPGQTGRLTVVRQITLPVIPPEQWVPFQSPLTIRRATVEVL